MESTRGSKDARAARLLSALTLVVLPGNAGDHLLAFLELAAGDFGEAAIGEPGGHLARLRFTRDQHVHRALDRGRRSVLAPFLAIATPAIALALPAATAAFTRTTAAGVLGRAARLARLTCLRLSRR